MWGVSYQNAAEALADLVRLGGAFSGERGEWPELKAALAAALKLTDNTYTRERMREAVAPVGSWWMPDGPIAAPLVRHELKRSDGDWFYLQPGPDAPMSAVRLQLLAVGWRRVA